MTVPTLRLAALEALRLRDPDAKAACVRALDPAALPVGADAPIAAPPDVPGRPDRPELVAPARLKARGVQSPEGRAVLLHALAHIEFNAINLALDVAWRFPGLPDAFYRAWVAVAREEAFHFTLLRDRLAALGHRYGDFPAHDGLWEMAERTKDDLLARIALVPRTMEARGLDASPPIRAKLAQAGDAGSAAILDIILRDEIGHVALGNHWFRQVCAQRGLEPLSAYADLSARYRAPRQRGPFNLDARRQAGFDEAELGELLRLAQEPAR